MLQLPTWGIVRDMKVVCDNPEHQALRARNELRLARLKAENRLYEEKDKKDERASTAAGQCANLGLSHNQAQYLNANNAAQQLTGAGQFASTLAGLGIGWWNDFSHPYKR